MSSLEPAFSGLLKLVKLEMTIERLGRLAEETIYAAPSNYSRNLSGQEDMSVQGKEFIISKEDLNKTAFTELRRGDVLNSTMVGKNTISDVKDIIVLGNLIGYRVRTK